MARARASGLLAVWFGLASAATQAGPPDIALVSPRALRPGSAAVLVLKGKELAGTRTLWTSWAGRLDRNDAEGWECLDDSLKIPVFVPASHPAGIEGIRILGTNGVSNLAWVLVDGLRSESLQAGSAPDRSPPVLKPPVAVDGVMLEAGVRVFRLPLNRGQRISLEVVAQRWGSPTDPVLRVLDAAGNERVYANDTPGLGSDVALEFQAPDSGDYRVELRDAEYLGGPAQAFRLRVGSFPVGALAAEPVVGIVPDSNRQPSEVGWVSTVSSQSGWARARVASTAAGEIGWARLELTGSHRREVLMPRTEAVPGRVAAESEPNDRLESATVLDSPGLAVGQFNTATDQDWYRFSVSTAGWWRIQARSRSLGRTSDPQLRLVRADGSVVASATAGDPDPAIFHRFETPGPYWISISDAGRRHGPGREYVLELDSQAGAFRTSTETERVHVPVGGKQTLKIKVEPRGYDGTIRIEAEGLPAGFEMENPVVEARKKEWDLVIRCRAEVDVGQATPVRFRARATAEGGGGTAGLEVTPAQRKAFPRMLWVPPGLIDNVWVGAVPAEKPSG